MIWRSSLLWITLIATGCSGGDDTSKGNADPNNVFGNNPSGTGSRTASGAGGSSGSAGTNAGVGDLMGAEACKHVDLVIAVDGSSSMTEELQAMRDDIFPAFAARLKTLGAGLDDYRVATLDACPTPSNFHTRGTANECNFVGGKPWIESTSPAGDAEFACVGDIYIADQQCSGNNDDEQPASAIASALEEPSASGPNLGFQRPDALVVAIAITDEDEQPTGSADTPELIYNRLAGVVADDPRRMVFLGIGGGSQCEGVYGSAEDAVDLRALTALFGAHGRGVFWDLCQGRLEDGLDKAFQVIERACNELPPCGGLDVDCGSSPPGGPPGNPFCMQFPDDPSCIVD